MAALLGAEVEVAEDGKDALMAHQEAAAWIDLFMHRSSQPAQWTGLYLCLDPMQEPSSHPEIDGQSVLSIAQGLERLLLNVALVQQELLTQRQLGLKVLVAEDNPINQMTLRDQLEQLGCQVTLADDGEDALAMWDMEAHDVVLTDVNMPRMNGYELARTLRAEGCAAPLWGLRPMPCRMKSSAAATRAWMSAWSSPSHWMHWPSFCSSSRDPC